MGGVKAMRYAGWLAAVSCGLAALGFGAALEGFSHAQHPLALLGARGMPHALWFNLFGFVLPGLLAAVIAFVLRERLPVDASGIARIGAWLVLLSGCAFAAQGLLPLDPADLEAPASQQHAAMWMLWVIGFVAGGAALAVGLAKQAAWRWLVWPSTMAALALPLLALIGVQVIDAGFAQRLALAVWLGWLLVVTIRKR